MQMKQNKIINLVDICLQQFKNITTIFVMHLIIKFHYSNSLIDLALVAPLRFQAWLVLAGQWCFHHIF